MATQKFNPVTGLYEDDPNAVPGTSGKTSLPNLPTTDTTFGTPTGQPDSGYTGGSPYFEPSGGAASPNPGTINPTAPYAGGSGVSHPQANPALPALSPISSDTTPAPTTPTSPAPAPTATDTGANATGAAIGGGAGPQLAAPPSGDAALMALVNKRVTDLLNTPQTLDTEGVLASPEASAYRLQNQRQTERLVANTAEHAAYDGTMGGGSTGIQRGLLEKEGENNSIFAGSLAKEFRDRQIQQLKDGIQFAIEMGQFDKAQSLQERLAQLSSDTSRSNTLDQLGLGYASLETQANNAALIAALG